MKLVSIDYGRRRVGIATVSDDGLPVRGLPTIDRRKNPDIISSLLEVVEREKPDRLVFGLPLDRNDAETVMSKEVRTFARRLEERTGVPASFIDESGSSLHAEALLRFRKKRERRDKGAVDRLAACLILDQFLRENGCM
jgi:putative Holliday junction resolvase